MTKSKDIIKRIIMVDCWTTCDKYGKPIGHGCKVGNEYYRYLNDDFEIIQYVNKNIYRYLENKKKKEFPYSLQENAGKLKRFIVSFKNMRKIYDEHPESMIWVYLQNIYLILFIMLFPKGERKIALTLYEAYSESKIKQWILMRVLKKIDLVFVTNLHLQQIFQKGILVPDYTYDPKIYKKYVQYPKFERVVCLGTMNRRKQIEEAVRVFTLNGYPLYIIGQFSSKKKFHELLRIKGLNIEIEDRYVDETEYYHLLGSSKYSLLPYDERCYKDRTSGILQESIFLNTIPITCQSILDFSGIKGVGYENMMEISKMDLKTIENAFYINHYEKIQNEFYDYDAVSKKIRNVFKKIV